MSIEFHYHPMLTIGIFPRWLYVTFLAIDANFCIKLKSRGINDPETGSGWSYFVQNQKYTEHVSQTTIEKEVSLFWPHYCYYTHAFQVASCGTDFHAINQANSRSSKDYLVSGIVACICARHSLMQKNGVGDLKHGEWWYCLAWPHNCKPQMLDSYMNMDYIVASVLKGVTVRQVMILYDIACKWSIHHLKQFSNNHPDLSVKDFNFSYLVPKFHLPAHGESCQTGYSFNYAKRVGHTHGETRAGVGEHQPHRFVYQGNGPGCLSPHS